MFNITLYRCYCDANQLDKSNNLKLIASLYGTLKNSTSISNVEVSISLDYNLIKSINENVLYNDGDDLVQIDDVIVKYDNEYGFNYMYIDEFKRYYFINDIILDSNLIILKSQCDVLMSFKDNIKDLNALVIRNEFEYNDLIVDNQIYTYYDNEVIEYIPDDPINPSYRFTKFNNNMENLSAIAVVRGNWLESGGGDALFYNDDIVSNNNVLPSLNAQLINFYYDNFNKSIILFNNYRLITKFIHNLDSTTQSYLESITLYPFEIEKNSRNNQLIPIYLNKIRVGDSLGYGTKYTQSPYIYIADFTINGESFKDYEPYTTYEIFLPYHNWVSFKANDILNKRLIVCYTLDYYNITSTIYVIDATDDKLLYSAPSNLGIRYGLTIDDSYDIRNQQLSNTLNMIVGGVQQGVNTGVSFASGDVINGFSNSLNLMNTIGHGVIKNNMLYTKASSYVSSTAEGLYSSQQVRIRKTTIKEKYIKDYNKYYGKPLNEVRRLGDLKGFTIASDFHLENFSTATISELNSIESILKNGFII